MQLNKITQVQDFIDAINKSKGVVWLVSKLGDRYNLKSFLTQYVAIGALISNRGDELELYCDNLEDEALFLKFFNEHPETI